MAKAKKKTDRAETLATAIADKLFQGGAETKADRLVMRYDQRGVYGGGWGYKFAIDVIAALLRESGVGKCPECEARRKDDAGYWTCEACGKEKGPNVTRYYDAGDNHFCKRCYDGLVKDERAARREGRKGR
jgi:ribosomal protein L37AE/L43A